MWSGKTSSGKKAAKRDGDTSTRRTPAKVFEAPRQGLTPGPLSSVDATEVGPFGSHPQRKQGFKGDQPTHGEYMAGNQECWDGEMPTKAEQPSSGGGTQGSHSSSEGSASPDNIHAFAEGQKSSGSRLFLGDGQSPDGGDPQPDPHPPDPFFKIDHNDDLDGVWDAYNKAFGDTGGRPLEQSDFAYPRVLEAVEDGPLSTEWYCDTPGNSAPGRRVSGVKHGSVMEGSFLTEEHSSAIASSAYQGAARADDYQQSSMTVDHHNVAGFSGYDRMTGAQYSYQQPSMTVDHHDAAGSSSYGPTTGTAGRQSCYQQKQYTHRHGQGLPPRLCPTASHLQMTDDSEITACYRDCWVSGWSPRSLGRK